MADKIIWTTASVYRETSDAITIIFNTNGVGFDYQAGQFINLSLVIEGENVSRSYSLSSFPGYDELPAITVKKMEGGIASNYIFYHAEEIAAWTVEGPFGAFYPTAEAMASEDVVLLAAGSGITPIFSIIKFLLTNARAQLTLLYSSRKWNNTIFRSVIGYLQHIYRDRLNVYYFFTGQDGSEGFTGSNFFHGRINRLLLKKLVGPLNARQTTPWFFICGPASFIESSVGWLHSIGVEEGAIRREYFTAPQIVNPATELPNKTLEVLVHWGIQTSLLEVAHGQTILEAALAEGIAIPYSCKQGTCGRCVANRLSGSVAVKNNFALTAQQVAGGSVLLCQSHPLDNEVTIEVNGI